MKLDPVSLRLFVAVMEESTIAAAAAREHLAASAVSRRLADLEARYTQERHDVDVTQARLFGLLRPHYQQRDRLRLLVSYRRQYLDALVYDGEEAAEAVAQQCNEAWQQSDAEYEQVAFEAAEQKALPEDEARELKECLEGVIQA